MRWPIVIVVLGVATTLALVQLGRKNRPTYTGKREMEQAQDPWLAEHRRLQADLWVFQEHVRSKQDSRGEWTTPPSVEEKVFDELTYFYHAALLNESDVSNYVPYMIEKRGSLEKVGAVGCLAALDQLLPLYAEQQERTSELERAAYWTSKQAERERAAALAEDANAFGRLLLAYAVRNRDKFGGVQPSEESRARYEQAVHSALESLGIPLQ